MFGKMNEKFTTNGTLSKGQCEVNFSVSMSLLPSRTEELSLYSTILEEDRVSIRFSIEEETKSGRDRRCWLFLDRKQAKQLGEQLVRYGNMKVQGDKGYEETTK